MNDLIKKVPDSALTESKDSNLEMKTPTLQAKYSMNQKLISAPVLSAICAHKAELKNFILLIRPTGLIAISGINPKQFGLVGKTFDVETQLEECIDYIIELEKQKLNVHFAVNEPNCKINGKVMKSDIKEVSCVHLDVDPEVGNYTASRNELLDSVDDLVSHYKPGLVIDSGNGIQLFWKHKTALSIDDGEDINKRMIKQFNGDKGTWNADRLMRVPFTLNYPTATKVAKGYPVEPRMATILYQEGM